MLRIKYGFCWEIEKSAQIDTKYVLRMCLVDMIKY